MRFGKLALGLTGLAVGYALTRASSPQIPPGIVPVKPFDLTRYLGKWYEVGRLENRFERGLTRTTAEYSLNPDQTVKVVNRGFDPWRGRWTQATGTARFVRSTDEGALKVSFFGPFYGGYNIVDIDEGDYQWSIVVGSTRSYFWVLSREPEASAELKARAVAQALLLGINPDAILWVPQ
ncbi:MULTISPECIES: lipocalin family protein [unclassified Ochrobactrum]|uniref:lipocalin family protein n=1 Tax=unclassified Ochrobactrum TaxID=239106 RepID=UPI000DDAE620|nr:MULTISPECIES: lipocalin family protein [unclassified Ochrobactrum]MBQ0710227.1 lipocalin family protein [Ochrobactrum sp. AP1BH01-1]